MSYAKLKQEQFSARDAVYQAYPVLLCGQFYHTKCAHTVQKNTQTLTHTLDVIGH